jgi:hypothetical protein
MGTRTLISINGKPMIATHWDAYPTSFGFRSDHSKIPHSPMMPRTQKTKERK